jgi:hypothetical protein
MTSAHVENLEFDTSQRDGSVNVAATTPIERPKMAANTPREWPKGRSRGGKLLVRRMADVRICNIADGGRRQMFNWSPTGKSRIKSLISDRFAVFGSLACQERAQAIHDSAQIA